MTAPRPSSLSWPHVPPQISFSSKPVLVRHTLTHRSISGKKSPLKRWADVIITLGLVCIGAPLFLAIGAAIKLSSKGPIIYSHDRVGRHGKLFRCYKFRTMYPQSDKKLDLYLTTNPQLKKEWQKRRKLKDDPRVTRIGALLRKLSLDELPQLINVLKGEMSLVGPRPVPPEELQTMYGAQALAITQISPGCTGLWQVSGRSGTSYQERIELDLRYLQAQSFWLDMRLILRTVPAMLRRKGAC